MPWVGKSMGPMDASGIWGGKMQLSLHSSCQSGELYFSLDGLQVLLELFMGGQCESPQPNGAPLIHPALRVQTSPYKGVPWVPLGLTRQAYSWNMLVPK